MLWPAAPLVGEERIFQIVAQVGVGKGEIPVLIEILPEEIVLCLPRVLQGRQVHAVNAFARSSRNMVAVSGMIRIM